MNVDIVSSSNAYASNGIPNNVTSTIKIESNPTSMDEGKRRLCLLFGRLWLKLLSSSSWEGSNKTDDDEDRRGDDVEQNEN